MEMVEVVIKMPKSEYEELQGNYVWWGRHGEYIKKGTVLPKGHGDLVDRKQIIEHGDSKGFCDWYEELKYAPIVIEADKDGDTD